MTLLKLPSAPPTRSPSSCLLSGCFCSLVITVTRYLDLVRPELSIRFFNLPETQALSPVLSHLRVSLLSALPKPPPEPPDPRSLCLSLAYPQRSDLKSHSYHQSPICLDYPNRSHPVTVLLPEAPPPPASTIIVARFVLCSGSWSELRPLQLNAPNLPGFVLLGLWPILSHTDCCRSAAHGLGPFPCYSWYSVSSSSEAQSSWFSFYFRTVLDRVRIRSSLDESLFTSPSIFTILAFTILQSSGQSKLPVERLTPQKPLFRLVAAEAGRNTVSSPLSPPFPDKLTRVLDLLLHRKVILPGLSVSLTFHMESTMHLRFGHLKLSVLFLAGEGTSGSWIPVFAKLHILFRRCTILDLVHILSIASSVLKKSLPRKLCYMVTRVSIRERVSSPSFIRGKRITFALILSMNGELFSVSKPKTFSSFMERVLLSFASMAMAKVEQAVYDHVVVVLGLKKADVKSTSFGGVLHLASGNEFSTRILCSGNSASLSISKEESTHGGYSEFIMLFSFNFFSLVVCYCNFRNNSYVESLPPLRGVTQV